MEGKVVDNDDKNNSSSDSKNKKVVLITGCAKGGIGYEYCRAFAELGCHVVATDLPERLPGLSDLPGEALPLDVTSDESVAAATRRVLAAHGRVDVVVNNAGEGCTGPLAELSLAAVSRAWQVNALRQLRLVRAGASSTLAGAYSASKAAAHAATEALRLELRPFGVHVIKVVPGAVRSNLGHAHTANLKKAECDLYRGFEDAIQERAHASQVGGATDARNFARHVACLVMRARRPRDMTGQFAALAWSPVWVRGLFLAKWFGLDGTA